MVRTTAICKWCLCLPGPGGLSALHCYGLRLLGSLTQEACDAPPSGHNCTVMLALHMLSVNRSRHLHVRLFLGLDRSLLFAHTHCHTICSYNNTIAALYNGVVCAYISALFVYKSK